MIMPTKRLCNVRIHMPWDPHLDQKEGVVMECDIEGCSGELHVMLEDSILWFFHPNTVTVIPGVCPLT